VTRRTHNGRRGYPGLPADWGERLSTAAGYTHTDTCTISAPGQEGVFNPDTGEYDVTPGAIRYSGKCRVAPLNAADSQTLVTEQNLPGVKYLVAVDYSVANVQVRDVVTITSGDPQLVGQKLYVAQVRAGSQRVQRDLYCTDDQSF
jgi:uncharacterized protein DUF6093